MRRGSCTWDMAIRCGDPSPVRGSERSVWETWGTFKTDTSASYSMPCGVPTTQSICNEGSRRILWFLIPQTRSRSIGRTRSRRPCCIARAFGLLSWLLQSPRGEPFLSHFLLHHIVTCTFQRSHCFYFCGSPLPVQRRFRSTPVAETASAQDLPRLQTSHHEVHDDAPCHLV